MKIKKKTKLTAIPGSRPHIQQPLLTITAIIISITGSVEVEDTYCILNCQQSLLDRYRTGKLQLCASDQSQGRKQKKKITWVAGLL